ncbi:helix-turn-helix domain-containing protein [Aquincola sp. MAHUQ-54]|uniref:Helix-turn-helix domain-containing protein n=1 Tax=Aquincola agrisoli TaxID=3119538 RepID=A0AAW9Q5W0_9BURK
MTDSSSFRPPSAAPGATPVVAAKKRRSQVERTEETRGKLIAAAVEVLNEVGFTKTTSLAIAQRAKVSRGAFQHQFGTVQNLMLQIVKHLSHELVGQIELESIRFVSPAERLRAIALRYWAVYQSPEYRAVLLIWLGSAQDDAFVERIDKLMQGIDLQRDQNWTEIFADQDIPPKDLHNFRRLLLAAVRGLAIHAIYSRRPVSFDDVLGLVVRLWTEMTAERNTTASA